MKNIYVLTNHTRDKDFAVTRQVTLKLVSQGARVALSSEAYSACGIDNTSVIGEGLSLEDTQLIVVIGGDGSILDAADSAMLHDIPVLGVNVGRLGYLSGMDPTDIDRLSDILQGRYSERDLMTLSVSIYRNDEMLKINRVAVNEAVISHGNLSRLSSIEVSCENNGSVEYLADGVIISTPAGSTAYSLSAGGPIVESTLDSICITPICPHSFFARSILISPDSIVRVKLSGDDLFLTVDGRENTRLTAGDIVEIRRSSKKFKLLSATDYNLLGILKSKMKMN